jgi:hypothetical protein
VILFKLLALPITAPAAGIRYCIEKVIDVAQKEMWDEGPIREELILLNQAYEEGSIPDPEFREREAELLARMREVREHNKEAARAERAALPDEGKREVVIDLPDELK